MSRLVTGLFYSRSEAEQAVRTLQSEGIAVDDIYLETEVEPSEQMGRKGGEVSSLERERRIAGTETGLIIGLAVGLLAGFGVGMLGSGIVEATATMPTPGVVPAPLTSPATCALFGAILGLIVGGLIGWTVDNTLSRMGAGPPLPREETLVTIRTSEDLLDTVYAALFRARARHLHVSERAV
jgi:hypothetical protein